MRSRTFGAIVVLLLAVLPAGCGATASSPTIEQVKDSHETGAPMKGYELYSWPAGDEWYFSVLEGTNRLKTYEEVTAPGVAIKGVDSVVARLGQLAKGAQVTWSRSITGLSFPPEEMMSRVKGAASGSGLELHIGE